MQNDKLTAIVPTNNSSEPLELGSDQDVADELGVSRCTVWRYANNGTIPKAVKISPGCSRFDMKAIRRMIAERAADSTIKSKHIRRRARQADAAGAIPTDENNRAAVLAPSTAPPARAAIDAT